MRPAIIIPVFNHASSVVQVTESLRTALTSAGETIPMILINDGSTDQTAAALAMLKDVTILTHPRNRGKGAALLTGFRHAQSMGFIHAITVDADGQHDPADVLAILAAARAHPADLILGQRDMSAAQVPAASKKGRDAARFWLRVQTGLDLPDTQCGLRAYPLAAALAVPQRFRRYDYETEILARMAWGGVRIRSVPVKCIYFSPEHRVTHFRPIIDTVRGVRVNVFLVFRRLLPLPFHRLTPADPAAHVHFGRWWKWSTWRRAVREALRTGSSNSELAMAFAMGIFVGLTPFYMLQTILAIYFARRLHLNPLAAVIGSQISIPPLAPIWAALSYAVGQLMIRGEWGFSNVAWSWNLFWPFLVGNVFVAAIVAVLGLFAARALLSIFRVRL